MNLVRSKTRVFLFAIVAAAAAGDCLGQSDEDYKVYDAVIRAMFRDGITQFDMNAKIDQIVIRDRTFSSYARGDKKEDWEQVKFRMRLLTDETIAGYESARKTDVRLKKEFEVPFKYLLISDKQLSEIFPNKQDYDKSFAQWNDFNKRYPKSAGYNSFSKVGYDKSGGSALVYFVNWCGPVCGTGTYVLVVKSDNEWVVKEAAGMWIS